MAKLKNGWVKKIIDGVSEKIFAISHVKSTYYNYTEGKLLSDKLDEIDTEIESTKNKVDSFSVTKKSVTDALGYTPYTPNEVDNKFSTLETNIDWKEAVDTFSSIATTYPNPEDGWTVNVKDTDYTYRYNGSEWVAISANAIPKATNTVDGLLSKEDHTKYEDANTKKHTHSNKSILDAITAEFTTEHKTKLDGIATGANKTVVDSALSTSSTNPVQNKVIASKVNTLNTSITEIKNSMRSKNINIPESFRFYNCVTKKNADGSILETYDFGTLLTTKNSDGSYTEVFTDKSGNKTTKTTVVSEDGTVTETVV